MASSVIYPPIVDAYMPAFVGNTCRVYFSLSKFNSLSDLGNSTNRSIHISITKQDTGMNVVSVKDDETAPVSSQNDEDKEYRRFRSTSIIIDATMHKVQGKTNLYYVDVFSTDLETGWQIGWVYKIQLRLSSVRYGNLSSSQSITQSDWLKNNAQYFSEWSTICTVKCTAPVYYRIPIFDIDTSKLNDKNDDLEEEPEIESSTLDIFGHFIRNGVDLVYDPSESIYKYRFILYKDDLENTIIEDSQDIYANQYQDNDSFRYLFKTQLIDGATYHLAFKFETINGYVDGKYYFDDERDDRITFINREFAAKDAPCTLISIDIDPLPPTERGGESKAHVINKNSHYHYAEDEEINRDLYFDDNDFMSIAEEEEEGRIGIKFYSPLNEYFTGNLCIRRADARDNFQRWVDIYVYVAKNELINEIPIFYDYTIESGVWYKYGVQAVDIDGFRTKMNIMGEDTVGTAVMRNFNYSFLLGQNNQQLKLKFDNTMNNFKYQIYDASIDPLGGRYPVTTRNGNTYYRTFPINGLISFYMDDNKLFCTKEDIYKYEDVINKYSVYNAKNNITQYDYIYERDFRNKVLEFLQDGELKLFKSPTEGNIIVRLTDINCTPNQTLDRMIYSFSATAKESDDNTFDNYLKYKFHSIEPFATEDFATYETRLGQLIIDASVIKDNNTDILNEIFKKYDSNGKNVGGFVKTVLNVHHIKITFEGLPLKINLNGENVLGNSFKINKNTITVLSPNRIYEFDERLIYDPRVDTLLILGDSDQQIKTVKVTVDFLYDFKQDEYRGKRITTKKYRHKLGQIFEHLKFNTNQTSIGLYSQIYYKFYLEKEDEFMRLENLSSIDIEAPYGACFSITESEQGTYTDIHEVGITNRLNLYEITGIKDFKYLGIRNQETGEIEQKPADVIINYIATIVEGKYREEVEEES